VEVETAGGYRVSKLNFLQRKGHAREFIANWEKKKKKRVNDKQML
jgi:hypothetical protein